MSAPESAVAPVEEVRSVDAAPAVEAVVASKVEEVVAAVAEVAAPVVEAEAPATEVEPTTTEEPAKEEIKPVEGEPKESSPKAPNFLSKLLGTLTKAKGEKKVKVPKSPKKKEKKDEVEAPTTEEAPKETPVEAPETVKEEATEPVPAPAEETEIAPVVEAVVAEEIKEENVVIASKEKVMKVSRRLSARVGDFFFKSKSKLEVPPTAKVDEHPPTLGEPVPVAPLANPALDEAAAAKPVEPEAPIVAAAA